MKSGDGPPPSAGEFSGLSSSGHSFTRHGDETVRGNLPQPSAVIGTCAGAAAMVVVVACAAASARTFARARPASAASTATLRPLRLCPSIICQFHHIMPSATAPQMTLPISGSPMVFTCFAGVFVGADKVRCIRSGVLFDSLMCCCCRCLCLSSWGAEPVRVYTLDVKPRENI